MKNTSANQDTIVRGARQDVTNVIDALIEIIAELDERLTRSMDEANQLRLTVDSLEHRIEELKAKQ